MLERGAAIAAANHSYEPRRLPSIPPLGWRKEIPLYRISADTHPAPKERFRFETPFSQQSDASIWQYGERVHKVREVISTTEWPNPGAMTPLNYAAQQVMEFFTTHQKSRMQRSPWRDGQVFLDNGLSNPLPKIGLPKLPSVEVAVEPRR
jgi:hypothetical protein